MGLLKLLHAAAVGTNVEIRSWNELNTHIQTQLRFYGNRPLVDLGFGTSWTVPTDIDYQYFLDDTSFDMTGFAPIQVIEKEVNVHGRGIVLDAGQLGRFFDLRNNSVLRLHNVRAWHFLRPISSRNQTLFCCIDYLEEW